MKAKFDPKRKDWCVITTTDGGTVSILNNLTLDQALKAAAHLQPPWLRPESFSPEGGTRMFNINKGTITMVKIIGPEGWESNTVHFGA